MRNIAYFGSDPEKINQYSALNLSADNQFLKFYNITDKVLEAYENQDNKTISLEVYAEKYLNLTKDAKLQLYGAWINAQAKFNYFMQSSYKQSLFVLKDLSPYQQIEINPFDQKGSPSIILASTLDVEKTNMNIEKECQFYFNKLNQFFGIEVTDKEKKQYILEKIEDFYQYMILYDLTIEEKRDIRTLNDSGLLFILTTK